MSQVTSKSVLMKKSLADDIRLGDLINTQRRNGISHKKDYKIKVEHQAFKNYKDFAVNWKL